jgi:hypothetical protein
MITVDHPLIQLLALIDMVWIDAERVELKRGAPKFYSEKTTFKVDVVSDRRILDRRLREIAP